jgi:hypothetical protein
MTSRMVRCRSVSDDFTVCTPPPALADGVSLLSLMALNVAAHDPRIKHVFDRRVAQAWPARLRLSMGANRANHKCVTRADTGYLCFMMLAVEGKDRRTLSVVCSSVLFVRHASLKCSYFEHMGDSIEHTSEN